MPNFGPRSTAHFQAHRMPLAIVKTPTRLSRRGTATVPSSISPATFDMSVHSVVRSCPTCLHLSRWQTHALVSVRPRVPIDTVDTFNIFGISSIFTSPKNTNDPLSKFRSAWYCNNARLLCTAIYYSGRCFKRCAHNWQNTREVTWNSAKSHRFS